VIDYPLVEVIEGKTIILVPDVEAFRKSPSSFPPSDAPVFYNKRMEINRDFALALLRVYLKKEHKGDEFLYCEPMAGSGIRSVRVAKEIDNINVIINDRNPLAVELIRENISQLNLSEKTQVYEEDANELMLRFSAAGKKFDIIDIDPFGTPAPFLDAAAQAINKNGLLAITSTDMATKCGVYPKACLRKYASQPIHTWIGHEMAVRILLGFTAITLARHGRSMNPIFVQSTDHFIRCYVIAEKNITKAKNIMNEMGYAAHCTNCYSIEYAKGIINHLSVDCPKCENKRLIGGPIWLGKMYNMDFVIELQEQLQEDKANYGTKKKMQKMLELIMDEVKAENSNHDIAFYYDIHQITDKFNLISPKSSTVIKELQKGNFIATRTHFKHTAIKTNAPIEKIISAIKKAINT